MKIYLAACTETICHEVEQGFTQKSIALTYALAILTHHAKIEEVDWRKINTAILGRWKMSGLERIKESARQSTPAHNTTT